MRAKNSFLSQFDVVLCGIHIAGGESIEPITTLIAVALAQGLVQVGGKLLEKSVVEPALEPATGGLKQLVQRGYQGAKKDKALSSQNYAIFCHKPGVEYHRSYPAICERRERE